MRAIIICLFLSVRGVYWKVLRALSLQKKQFFSFKLPYFNFHPLEVVARNNDPQIQVGNN